MKTYTINGIQAEMTADGSHWWDKSALRYFGSRISSKVYQGKGGIYFVSSEQFDSTRPRGHSCRQYDPATKQISTVRGFNCFTRAQAHHEAARLAGPSAIVSKEAHKKPTDAEQLALDIKRNGGRATVTTAAHLIRLAKRYDRMQTRQCNEPVDAAFYVAETKVEAEITKAAERCLCGVKLGGDPRGSVVKLILPSGQTNDFVKAGWFVPVRGRSKPPAHGFLPGSQSPVVLLHQKKPQKQPKSDVNGDANTDTRAAGDD